MTATLFQIHYSPWSERARFALDHHRVAYTKREYTPILSTPALRIRAGKWRGAMSVPVFADGEQVVSDSFDIAKLAEERGSGTPLFPTERSESIDEWERASQRFMRLGRAVTMKRLARDRGALEETFPRSIPNGLRPWLLPMARATVSHVASKYAISLAAHNDAELLREMTSILERWRAELDGRATRFERFSFADLAMAVAMQGVRPVDDKFLPLRPHTRRVWTIESLEERFADLLAWRDSIYAQHRRRT